MRRRQDAPRIRKRGGGGERLPGRSGAWAGTVPTGRGGEGPGTPSPWARAALGTVPGGSGGEAPPWDLGLPPAPAPPHVPSRPPRVPLPRPALPTAIACPAPRFPARHLQGFTPQPPGGAPSARGWDPAQRGSRCSAHPAAPAERTGSRPSWAQHRERRPRTPCPRASWKLHPPPPAPRSASACSGSWGAGVLRPLDGEVRAGGETSEEPGLWGAGGEGGGRGAGGRGAEAALPLLVNSALETAAWASSARGPGDRGLSPAEAPPLRALEPGGGRGGGQ